MGIAARRVFFQTTPELWTFKSFTDLFHGERKTTSLRDSKRSVVGSPAQQHSCSIQLLRKCSRSGHNSSCGLLCLPELGTEESWPRSLHQLLLVLGAVNAHGAKTSWAPLSSIVTQHVITSPPRLRLEPERTLTSQRQLGEPPFPITSTVRSDGIFCKKLKPSVPDDKLVFIRKYKSCVVRLFCTMQFTKLVLVAAAIDRCPVKQDLYCIKMFVILRQQEKKYFHGWKFLLGNYCWKCTRLHVKTFLLLAGTNYIDWRQQCNNWTAVYFVILLFYRTALYLGAAVIFKLQSLSLEMHVPLLLLSVALPSWYKWITKQIKNLCFSFILLYGVRVRGPLNNIV